MKRLATHAEQFSHILAFLFLVANTGFSAVLEYCAADCAAICSMETCADGRACALSCGNTLPHQDVAHAQTDANCHQVVVAGGLNLMPMVSETLPGVQVSERHIQVCVALHGDAPQADHVSADYLVSLPGAVGEPAVEKYVLNAAFLI